MKIKQAIIKEIENQKNVYKSDNSRIVADYNNEIETIKEYNGRQILELLQNADDELSDEVFIELDTNKNILIIANKGNSCSPFKTSGIKSLMVSNFSSKTTKKYIGNKGLGFRSVINWSNKITINSQNIDISFSKKIAKEFYNEICNEEKQKEILRDRNFDKDTIPIAFLSFPKIEANEGSEWVTRITIEYKKEIENSILEQLENIKNEILLFVKNINTLKIKIDEDIKIIERDKEKNKIYLNDKLWDIYEMNAILPKEMWNKSHEEEYFELKLAITEDFNIENNLLYSYFPTKIDIDFPFIIHGTFDLNSSRNDLNDNEKNRYILNKLVDLIIETSKKLTNNEVNYKALELLIHYSNNTTLKNLEFYRKIDESIQNLEIFPCLDNKYRKQGEVVFISNNFSNFIEKTDTQNIFFNMLKSPHNTSINLDSYNVNDKFIDYKTIDNLSNKIREISERAELIKIVYDDFKNQDYRFELIIDKNEDIISQNDETYTPTTKDYDFDIPSYVKIKFIHNALYSQLLQKFNIDSNEKSRDLQRELKSITNIQSYEPAQVLQKIITSTNKELDNSSNKIDIVKRMISSLYRNYKILGEKTKIPENSKIQLLSKEDSIENAKDLFLSKSYPSGELTEELFDDVFKSSQFLADIELFTFEENEDREQVESFFLWLGVNKYTKFEKASYKNSYENFIFTKISKPNDFKELSFTLDKIVNLNSIINYFIEKKQYEKYLLWILKDEKIQNEINSSKILTYFYRTDRYLYNAPSYVLYQFIQADIFRDYLITNGKLSQLVNSVFINFDSSLFEKYQINRADIESLILKIGGVDKFSSLSIESVQNIVKMLPSKSSDGKQTQTIYKECIEHYKKNVQKLADNTVQLFAKKGDDGDFYPQNMIYYNGNLKLPKNITDSMVILNFPRRQNTKDIINFFRINDLKSINIGIEKHEESISNKEFQDFFKTIIPFILVYRFETSKTEASRKKDTLSLKNIEINLCHTVTYKINSETMELENNDYINENKNYFIKVCEHQNFSELRKNLNFREVFADIIGTIFDINDMDKFSRLISDNIDETEEIIKRNIGTDTVSLVREYLGISDEIYSFWSVIYSLKNKEYLHDSEKNILQVIKNDLNITVDIDKIDYKDLKKSSSCEYIQKLFNELKITIVAFNSKEPYYKIDFIKFHNDKLQLSFHRYSSDFKQNLYRYCQEYNRHKEFLSIKGRYEHQNLIIEENVLDINYDEKVIEFIKDNFEFLLDTKILENKEEIDLESKYQDNKEKIDFEKIEDSNEYRSLLYFSDKIDEIKEYIFKKDSKKEKLELNSEKIKLEKPIVLATLATPKIEKVKQHKSSQPYKYSQSQNKSNKYAGDNAEQDVFNSLIREYGKENVEWVSTDDDRLKYDLRYNNNDVLKYVEVKTYSNKKFYLSKSEKEFAEKNYENYEIFLVGDEIYKITNIDFTKLNIFPTEYEVLYQVEQEKRIQS